MLFVENFKKRLINSELNEIVWKALKDFRNARKVLLMHPDYTRKDFSDRLVPLIYKELKNKGMEEIHSLNASGTHRRMREDEIYAKLGISNDIHFTFTYNHEYHDPDQLAVMGEIPASFVAEKTNGEFLQSIPVSVNKLITKDYDLVIALSATIPHETTGFSGGLKIFFPGISGLEVINLFHWAGVLTGIPKIIGSVDSPARNIINKASDCVFKRTKAPIVSFNMVSEEKNNDIIPKGLYIGVGINGFVAAYKKAARMSSKLHIVYINNSLDVALQVIDENYDEVWTAGKGSYKLQRPGVMGNKGEIIIYAPHINCFHSKPDMDTAIRQVGYHCLGYVKHFLRLNPKFNRNVAAHVINVRGPGTYNSTTGKEDFLLKVTLATGIPEDVCKAVGLGYRDPHSVHKEDFEGSGRLWIKNGGKYLYDIKSEI